MGSKRGDEHKRPCPLGEGTGPKGPANSEAPQRATASRLVPTHQIDPPQGEEDKRRYGYSRDKRSDCVQVVIALIVTPEGFPLAYEVLPGNTADSTTLRGFLEQIERQYGKAERVWVMDRGIPTEETLARMRESDPPIRYLVGTPKGRLSKLENELLQKPWHEARPGVEVKLLPKDGEMYVFAQSHERIAKERGMRKRQLKRLWARLQRIAQMKLTREQLLMKLGAAREKTPAAWRLVEVRVGEQAPTFTYRLRKDRLRQVRRREGRYLLRTNLTASDPAELWRYYIQLVQVEEAFKNLKGDLAIRPVFHQNEARIEAHIFVSFLAYCVHVTLRHRLRQHAPGLTPRAVLEKFATLTMLDAWFPTTDGRWLVFARYTQPEKEHKLLLATLELTLPSQAPPRITAHGQLAAPQISV
ncbi:MAG: IS1634 family transposase [Burkholderiales bacterium]|nr:IS1634 family transposase [Burkholderiales bacterium]